MGFLHPREHTPATSPVQPPETEESDPIAIFGVQEIIEGSTRRTDERLSNRLNAGDSVDVRVPASDGTEEWRSLRSDDVVAVAVPPQPSTRRMARRRHRLTLLAPPYEITGTAYMPAGADPARYARSTAHRWLALTDATVATPEEVIEVEVLLVNLDHVQRV